mmetsp:Transcript_33941/g.37914  ORF Transcript_33941/g.37914 Transcript_33941/m.37914 type:complete len:319 (-) Transcript_33941:244-1200(-)
MLVFPCPIVSVVESIAEIITLLVRPCETMTTCLIFFVAVAVVSSLSLSVSKTLAIVLDSASKARSSTHLVDSPFPASFSIRKVSSSASMLQSSFSLPMSPREGKQNSRSVATLFLATKNTASLDSFKHLLLSLSFALSSFLFRYPNPSNLPNRISLKPPSTIRRGLCFCFLLLLLLLVQWSWSKTMSAVSLARDSDDEATTSKGIPSSADAARMAWALPVAFSGTSYPPPWIFPLWFQLVSPWRIRYNRTAVPGIGFGSTLLRNMISLFDAVVVDADADADVAVVVVVALAMVVISVCGASSCDIFVGSIACAGFDID